MNKNLKHENHAAETAITSDLLRDIFGTPCRYRAARAAKKYHFTTRPWSDLELFGVAAFGNFHVGAFCDD